MSKQIKLHFQYSDGSYDEVIVDETNTEEIKRIHDNNNQIRRNEYLRKKSESKFTVEEVQRKMGHEFSSDELDPLEKMVLIEKENLADYAISLIAKAKETLTTAQLSVYELVVEKHYSADDAATMLHCTRQNANKNLRKAKSRISEFYSNYPEIVEMFPQVLMYLKN